MMFISMDKRFIACGGTAMGSAALIHPTLPRVYRAGAIGAEIQLGHVI
jgi:hypothetical protein